MSNKKSPEALQTIDPTTLGNVTGGTTSSGSSEVTAALTGVLDSLNSLKNQNSGGMDSTTMMMMMMMMGNRNQGATVVAPNTIGGYAGYTIDGVYYPFYR